MPVCSQKLSRAIYRPICSQLTGAQFADYIICLTSNHFVLVWTDSAFSLVHCSQFWLLTCLHMFHFHNFLPNSIPVYYKGLSRAIYPHNFSRLVGAQFAHCITCLPCSHFVSVWPHNYLSVSSLASHIYTHSLVWICLNMFCSVSCFMCPIW